MSPLIFLVLLLLCLSGPLRSQVPTRAAGIEAEREKKAAVLEPDEPTKAEQVLTRIKDDKIVERIQAGYNGIRG